MALRNAGTGVPESLSAAASKEKLRGLLISAHRFIAKTPSMLAAVRLADLTDEQQPTNIPGTSGSYPNWRPKLSVAVEDLASLPIVHAIADEMRLERGNSKPATI